MDWQKHFADRNRETSRFGASILQADDIDAINRYIAQDTAIKTDKARKLRDEWIKWHDSLGWWDKNMSQEVYDQARNRRNAFNVANATTAQQVADIKNVQTTGLSTEEMQGGVRRTLSDGSYSESSPNLIPTSFKVGVGVTLATILAGSIVYKLYVPDLKSWARKAVG